MLHLYLGDHDVGILVPAAPSYLYHAVPIVLSHCAETFLYVIFLSALVMPRSFTHSEQERESDKNLFTKELDDYGKNP